LKNIKRNIIDGFSITAKAQQSLGSDAIPSADTTQCPHCLKFVPKASFLMHSAQCSRRNYVCDICKQVIPIAEKQKHQQVAHSKVGVTLMQYLGTPKDR